MPDAGVAMIDADVVVKLRIGGQSLDVGSGGVFNHRNPYSDAGSVSIPLAGKQEMDDAIAIASDAAESWRRWRPADRRDALLRLAQLIEEHRTEFANLAAVDGGTPLATGDAMVDLAVAWTKYYAGWCEKLYGETISSVDTGGAFSYTTPEPFSVVGIIITWNAPLASLAMKAVPALAAGCAVVVKPSEFTPFAPDLFVRLARRAGIPDAVFSVAPGDLAAAEALISNPKVEIISFTGGPETARKILKGCAEQLKPAVMELGGKSASIVFPDVTDLPRACAEAIGYTIGSLAGQGCVAPSRLLVHEDLYDEAVAIATSVAEGFQLGNPFEAGTTIGPVINAAAADRIVGMIDRAVSDGAGRVTTGGGHGSGALAGKNFVEPTVIADADPDHEISQVEIFGPVVVVSKFSSEDDAVAIANGTQYGLGAYLWTSDVARVHRLTGRLRAGSVYVNGAPLMDAGLPFGGMGISGYGKEGGRAGIEEFLRNKSVTIGMA
jgi:aldehyde dehydrogenase (NAD+)